MSESELAESTPVRKDRDLGWRKKLFFWVLAMLLVVITVELGVRVLFAAQVGRSVFLYGTGLGRQTVVDPVRELEWQDHTVSFHDNVLEGYSKYHPYQDRVDHYPDTGERFVVGINGRGFRGPDFRTEKAAGTVRVITLGASSTFGYYSQDDETYPVLLEQMLNRRSPGPERFEVINLGIPHMHSDQILSLFLAEAVELDPDIVTYYEGLNDTRRAPSSTGGADARATRATPDALAGLRSLYRFVESGSLAVRFLDHTFNAANTAATASDLERNIEGKSDHLIDNLRALNEECLRRGIRFIVANQQAKSGLLEREKIAGITYREEQAMVRKKLADEGEIAAMEMLFATHDVLMGAIRDWAAAEEVTFVDVIGRLDQSRNVLWSEVHLSPAGNAMVAESFADAILEDAVLGR